MANVVESATSEQTLRRVMQFLNGCDPLLRSGGHLNRDLRDEVRARLSQAGAGGGVVDRDRLATIIQNTISENCSIDALEMEIDGTGPASFKAADRILAALAPSPSAGEPHPDDLAVDRFAAAMKAKLAKKRDEGRGGWDDDWECDNAYLTKLLREHVEKGDPVDVGNLAMMIHQRGERIATPPATPVQPTASVEAVIALIDAHEAAARERADKLFEMDLPSTDPGAASAFAVRNKLIEIGEEIRSLTPAPTQGDGTEPGDGMAEMAEIGRVVNEWKHGPMLSPEALRQITAILAKPASSPAPVSAPSPADGVREAFQQRVQPWMMACFGAEISADVAERNHRFLEEALELVQSTGCTASEAHQLVDYVFCREIGETHQEIGGVMVTLAALCLALGEDMHAAGETELARIWTKVEKIRAKQAAKPKHSPLPQHVPALSSPATPEPVSAPANGEVVDKDAYDNMVAWMSMNAPYRHMMTFKSVLASHPAPAEKPAKQEDDDV